MTEINMLEEQKNTILIVDDNAINLGALVGYLENYGFEVITARDGLTGLKRAEYVRPDLILLDVMMPGLDGFETCRRLKENSLTQNIPVIFMTSLTSTEDKVKGFSRGGVDYVTKPIQHEEVLARITTHLTLRNLQHQLQLANEDLEQRVADRTHRLQVRATISQQLNEIRNLNNLIDTFVNQLQQSFGYEQVLVYLHEFGYKHLVLVGASGDLGQKIKQFSQRYPIDQGPVGAVFWSNRPIVINDITESNVYRPHSDIPHTQAELALPLRLGDEVIGVLDIHSTQTGMFIDKDIDMLQSIASEAAIAINNARLLAEQRATILKLQELDIAKSQFLGVVSHELRTPMNIILGYTELLLDEVHGSLPLDIRESVGNIQDSAMQMVNLINNILDITLLEAGEFHLNIEPLDNIPLLVEDVKQTLTSQIANKPIVILSEISENLSTIQADWERLGQILLNIGHNAIKFTHRGRIIFKVKEATQPNFVKFTVIDTGIGIPVEKQQEIFQPFKLVDMSHTREYGGLGLGLALCRHLVELHGGEIGVQSKEGEGSEFYYTIPVFSDGD